MKIMTQRKGEHEMEKAREWERRKEKGIRKKEKNENVEKEKVKATCLSEERTTLTHRHLFN
jgi:hypothetical protein